MIGREFVENAGNDRVNIPSGVKHDIIIQRLTNKLTEKLRVDSVAQVAEVGCCEGVMPRLK